MCKLFPTKLKFSLNILNGSFNKKIIDRKIDIDDLIKTFECEIVKNPKKNCVKILEDILKKIKSNEKI